MNVAPFLGMLKGEIRGASDTTPWNADLGAGARNVPVRRGLGRVYVSSAAQTFLSGVSQGFQPALIRLSA